MAITDGFWKDCAICGGRYHGSCHHCEYRSARQAAVENSVSFAEMAAILFSQQGAAWAKCYCQNNKHEADEKTIVLDSRNGCLAWLVESPEPVPVRITAEIIQSSFLVQYE